MKADRKGKHPLNILPFIVQEAGPHFRGWKTFLMRGLYLGISGLVLAAVQATVASGETGAFARTLYNTFFITTYVAVCLLAPVLMAHAVFRDKVAGLASVIAAAPITPLDYCLGRLLGQLAALAAILIVGAPLFIVMIFLQAATPGEAVKGIALLALGGALSASLALGRAIDSDSFPGAVASTYALTLFPGCLTPLVWIPAFAVNPNLPAAAWAYLAIASPIPLIYNLLRSQTLFRRRFVTEGASLPPWQAREGRYRGPIPGNPVRWWETTRAGRILERNFGRADSLSGAVRILTGLAVLSSLIPICLHWSGVLVLFGMGVLTAAAQAASSVTTDREQKVWPTLISTPLSPEAVVFGKLAGILAGLRFVWIAAGLGAGIHLLLALGGYWNLGLLVAWDLRLLAFALLLVPVGLHASLMSGSAAKAMGRTLSFGLLAGAPPFILQGVGARLGPGTWAAVTAGWGVLGIALLAGLPAQFRRSVAREG